MASQNPFPLMPSKSTEWRLDHFDENVYRADPSSRLYKFMDALCGDAGAGSLKKEIFAARLGAALEGIYFSDLDYIFGNVQFLSRTQSESYEWEPVSQSLTSEKWDEVRVKDAWYRARIKDFFVACTYGGTPDGIRMAVQAATSADCDIQEVWRYADNNEYNLGTYVGRAPVTSRNEFNVVPHKANLTPREMRLTREMLARICPVDTIVTVQSTGLAVWKAEPVRAAAADSCYYEVQKVITPTPLIKDLPAPELLAIDLDPSEKWLFSDSPELAPYRAFNISSEYGYHYLVGGGRSPIDSVTYGTLQADGSVKTERPLELYEASGQFTDWREYDLADSPDNFPGGKYGLTPSAAPALNADKTPYRFQWPAQSEYVASTKQQVVEVGGEADDFRYRLPIQKQGTNKRVFWPELAIASTPPARDSSVTTPWLARRRRYSARHTTNFSGAAT
jgi:hypothetical protein